MKTYDILTVGAATIDLFIHSPAICLKKNLLHPPLLTLPHNSKVEIDRYFIQSGGGATNTAVSFSRLGLKTACLARLGRDHFGNLITKELSQNKVVTTYLSRPQKEASDFSVVLLSPKAGRSILVNRGPTRLEDKDIPWSLISRTSWLYLTSLEGNLSLLKQLINTAHKKGVKIALNPGSRELKSPQKLLPLLPQVEVLLLNRLEAETLTNSYLGSDLFENRILSLQTPLIAVTNSKKGAYIYHHLEKIFSPTANVRPLDETGAGDSFGSTFVTALIKEKSTTEALSWAMKNSASVVSHLGAKTGLLTLKKISQKT